MSVMPWLERFLVHLPVFRLWRRSVVGKIISALPSISGSVIELGSGDGTTTSELARCLPGSKVRGIEYDAAEVVLAQSSLQEFAPRVSVVQGDAAHLHFRKAMFCAVFSFLTLHHVEDWRRALKEAFRVLKSGGFLVVEDLALDKWTCVRHGFMARPPSCFSREEFLAAVRASGFVITDNTGTWHFVVIAKKP